MHSLFFFFFFSARLAYFFIHRGKYTDREKRNRLGKNQWYEGDFAMERTIVWQILAKAESVVRTIHRCAENKLTDANKTI